MGRASDDASGMRTAAIFMGAFLGPFAGMLTVSILPEIADTFDISTEAASITLVANVLPFATMMLFSGALGARIGKARTIKSGYGIYSVAALFCFFAPTWEVFLIGYAVCGLANSLTMPILMSILRDVSVAHKLGRRLGWYASMQALGQLSSPFLSGLLAVVNWKLTFIAVSVFSTLLLLVGLPQTSRSPSAGDLSMTIKQRWRYSGTFLPMYFVIGLASLGLPYLIGIFAFDTWNATSVERGTIIMVGGTAVLALSGFIGSLVDKVNPRAVTTIGACATTVGLLSLPFTGSPAFTTLAWCVVVLGGQTCIISLNKQVLTVKGSEPLISLTQSLRFFGNACSPALILPAFLASPLVGFWLCAYLTVLGYIIFRFSSPRD